MPKKNQLIEIRLSKLINRGQALGETAEGKKSMIWGGLPGETVQAEITKSKSSYLEGFVTTVLSPSSDRIEPLDSTSYLSTSPWQIMAFNAERRYKRDLALETFSQHDIALPESTEIYSDDKEYGYRNKMEFSFWWDKSKEGLDLAFFRRGSHGKIAVEGSSLAKPAINQAAVKLIKLLRDKEIAGYDLKTALIRASAQDEVVLQLYTKNSAFAEFSESDFSELSISGFEIIYSDPKSPASVITKRLQSFGNTILNDSILGINFTYPAESFFQINLPVYEQALKDIKQYIPKSAPVVDLYSGVGSIGLSVTEDKLILVEINQASVIEARKTIETLSAKDRIEALLSSSEGALDYIQKDSIIIVDPPRAGLDNKVIEKILFEMPPLVVYLSCNPSTQARDVAKLLKKYSIIFNRGYNFFPRTPHIEHLVILKLN